MVERQKEKLVDLLKEYKELLLQPAGSFDEKGIEFRNKLIGIIGVRPFYSGPILTNERFADVVANKGKGDVLLRLLNEGVLRKEEMLVEHNGSTLFHRIVRYGDVRTKLEVLEHLSNKELMTEDHDQNTILFDIIYNNKDILSKVLEKATAGELLKANIFQDTIAHEICWESQADDEILLKVIEKVGKEGLLAQDAYNVRVADILVARGSDEVLLKVINMLDKEELLDNLLYSGLNSLARKIARHAKSQEVVKALEEKVEIRLYLNTQLEAIKRR